MASCKPKIVVVGAGVSGLTSALELAKTGLYEIALLAEHMPGDYDIRYASPWAGANYKPFAIRNTDSEKYESDTWPVVEKLTKEVPEAGIHFQECFEYFNLPKIPKEQGKETAIQAWRKEHMAADGPWFSKLVPNFRMLTPEEAAPYDGGMSFTSIVINVGLYLPWLASQCLKYGVTMRRAVLGHILEAKHTHPSGQPADIIVNATGISAGQLPGVADPDVYPARAQLVLVRNEPNIMIGAPVSDPGATEDEVVYIMQRAAGGGTALGGSYQKDNWSPDVDLDLGRRIMERAVKLCPSLTDEKSMPEGSKWAANRGVDSLSVIKQTVGLRPVRTGGPRVETEKVTSSHDLNLGEALVVHNYGHGGAGYQSSYGCAFKVVRLVKEALSS